METSDPKWPKGNSLLCIILSNKIWRVYFQPEADWSISLLLRGGEQFSLLQLFLRVLWGGNVFPSFIKPSFSCHTSFLAFALSVLCSSLVWFLRSVKQFLNIFFKQFFR